MAFAVDQVASEALGLLAGEINPAVEGAHLEGVRRRRAAVRAGKAELIDGDEALRRARAALG